MKLLRPQIVAASGENGGVALRVAGPCVAAVLIGLVVIFFAAARTSALEQLNLEKPPDVLFEKAREIIARFGYTATPVDTARGFIYDDDFLRYLDEKEKPRHRWGTALSGRLHCSRTGIARVRNTWVRASSRANPWCRES